MVDFFWLLESVQNCNVNRMCAVLYITDLPIDYQENSQEGFTVQPQAPNNSMAFQTLVLWTSKFHIVSL